MLFSKNILILFQFNRKFVMQYQLHPGMKFSKIDSQLNFVFIKHKFLMNFLDTFLMKKPCLAVYFKEAELIFNYNS